MRKQPLFVLAVAAAALASAHCGGGSDPPAGRPQRPALRVRAAPVAVQDVVYQIKSLGQIEAQDMVQVTAQVEGVATDVRFREGDQVGPGTLLLRIDPDRYRLEAERARATLEQDRADQDRAGADLQRRSSEKRLALGRRSNRILKCASSRTIAGSSSINRSAPSWLG